MGKLNLAVVGLLALGLVGCVVNPEKGGIQDGAGIYSTAGQSEPINVPPLMIQVPNDPAIITPGGKALVGDLVISNYAASIVNSTLKMRVFFENKTSIGFTLHARIDNGMVGSGVRYQVAYEKVDLPTGGYQVTFQPKSKSTYQQGLIGKIPVPDFDEKALRAYLRYFTLRYRFEVDSDYPSDSTMANFIRLGNPVNTNSGFADPITGKIYKQYFKINYGDQVANYVVQVYPYKNGSKAVINMELPVAENAQNTVDFAKIIADLRKRLTSIAKS